MKKYFAILLVVVVMFASQIACGDSNYRGGFGDGLGIAGTLEDLTSR
jgi:hypothetical protein